MKTASSNTTANASQQTEPPSRPADDRLIDFRGVYARLGLTCKTGHTARNLAARGQIRAVRINARVIRYSENSVKSIVAGRHTA